MSLKNNNGRKPAFLQNKIVRWLLLSVFMLAILQINVVWKQERLVDNLPVDVTKVAQNDEPQGIFDGFILNRRRPRTPIPPTPIAQVSEVYADLQNGSFVILESDDDHQIQQAVIEATPTEFAFPTRTPGPTKTRRPTRTPIPTRTSTPTLLPVSIATPIPLNTPAITTWPTSLPEPTSQPIAALRPNVPSGRQEIGIQIHLHGEDVGRITDHLTTLRVDWVKSQVSWKQFEPRQDEHDENWFGELDQLVAAANENNIKVMLSVVKAPEWARPTNVEDGAPTDPAHFEDFMAYIATRYKGRVAAYELWNEANLQREWYGHSLSPRNFSVLVIAGATGVKSADSAALTISGAPASTGINDGVIAIDDRVFLQGTLNAGIANHVDAIGVHPYGWANHPDATSYNGVSTAPSHNDHPSFFFKETLDDYRTLLSASGYSQKPLWITEFGWGSFDSFGTSPPDGAEFMDDTTEVQQADYTIRALEMINNDPLLAPPILWNLNFGSHFGSDIEFSGYGLLRPNASSRPVYEAVKDR